MQIFYFGAPGNGFESYPKSYGSSATIYDKSHKVFGDIECKYIKHPNSVNIVYVMYGLGGEGDGSYRKGRNFGVSLKLDGYEIDKSERKNLHEFLHRFIYAGVNQDTVGIFVPNSGTIKDYKIKTFQECATILDKLTNNLERQFKQEFGNSIKPISNKNSFSEELDPLKLAILERKKKKIVKSKNDIVSANKQEKVDPDPDFVNNDNGLSKNNTPWWLLLFIPLVTYSIYSGIQLNKIKKEVIKNTISIAKIRKETPKPNATKKKLLRIEKKDNVKQFYLNSGNLSISSNVKIESFDTYVDHLVQLILASKELPQNSSKDKVLNKIVESNSTSNKKIKDHIEDLNKKKPNDTFFTDISLPNDLLIWEQ